MNQQEISTKQFMQDYAAKLIPPDKIQELDEMTQEEKRCQYFQNQVYGELVQEFEFKVANEASRMDLMNNEIVGGPYTYGEIDFLSLAEIVYVIQKRYKGLMGNQLTFIDLGSGCGKACLAAAITNVFAKSEGVEILEELHLLGQKLLKKIDTSMDLISKGLSQIGTSICPIRLYQDDFLKFNWSNGDLVFINATCYEADLLLQISEKAQKMKSCNSNLKLFSPFKNHFL